MKLSNCLLITIATLVPLAFATPAAHAEDLSTFTITGTVVDGWCLTGTEPPPQPCQVTLEISVENKKSRFATFWCRGELADVCGALPHDERLLVVGEDNMSEKTATHVALLLAPRG